MKKHTSIIPNERIEQRIFLFRGHRVMLDADLAKLYGVTTFNLNKAVKRNIERFPDDFMFQLTREEGESLVFQIGISKSKGRGGRRFLPYAFTQEGISMLSSVLRSSRAIHVNIAIMRTFVRLREMIVSNKVLAAKLAELESKIEHQGKDIKTLFLAIHKLMEPPDPPETPPKTPRWLS